MATPERVARDARMQPSPSRGLSLIEVVVVASILSVLAGAVVPRVTNHMAEARDARRLDGARAIVAAIERFRSDIGRLPSGRGSAAHGGFDVSHDGEFLAELVTAGYLESAPRDPIDDDRHHYAYYRYEKGAGGCTGDGPFYVLGIRAFETAAFAAQNESAFRCPDRDWSRLFAWSTGGGAVRE